MIKKAKKSDTGLRVLEVLKLLIQGPLSSIDISKLLDYDNENIYTEETIIKYITTLRVLGFNIDKKDKKYYLHNYPVNLHLDINELKTLIYIEKYLSRIRQKELSHNFYSVLSEIEKCYDYKTIHTYNNYIKEYRKELLKENANSLETTIMNKLDKLCKNGQKLKIDYWDNSKKCLFTYFIEPMYIKLLKNHLFLQSYNINENEYQLLLITNIKNIVQMPQRSSLCWTSSEVIFKLSDKLARVYEPRYHEKLLYCSQEEIIVKNSEEDKEVLLRRLLRYGSYCKIIKPKKYQNKFITMLDDIISYYETYESA